MQEPLVRDQRIGLVRKLMRGEGSEYEIAEWRKLTDRGVPCPAGAVFDYIFYSDRYGLRDNPTAEAIVDKALSYKPIQR